MYKQPDGKRSTEWVFLNNNFQHRCFNIFKYYYALKNI